MRDTEKLPEHGFSWINNIDDIRDDLVLMIAGEGVEAEIQNYAAVSMELHTKDEIYSAMVIYGQIVIIN